MDNINDNKKTDSIYLLLKNQKQKDSFVVLKKIEKIVLAIYMIIDTVRDDSTTLRAIQNESLNLLIQAQEVFTSELDYYETVRMLASVDHVIHLFKLGVTMQNISKMNADIICTELGKVATIVRDISREEIKQPVISGDILEDSLFHEMEERFSSKRHQNDIKETLIKGADIKDIKTTLHKGHVDKISPIDRKGIILDVIQGRSETTIHDIKKALPQVGEKTIQREISSLISMNLVKKEGNKRWTIYKAVKV